MKYVSDHSIIYLDHMLLVHTYKWLSSLLQNLTNRKKPGCGKDTAVDRSRMIMTKWVSVFEHFIALSILYWATDDWIFVAAAHRPKNFETSWMNFRSCFQLKFISMPIFPVPNPYVWFNLFAPSGVEAEDRWRISRGCWEKGDNRSVQTGI